MTIWIQRNLFKSVQGAQLGLFTVSVPVHAHMRTTKSGTTVLVAPHVAKRKKGRQKKHLDTAGPAAPQKGQKGYRAPPARHPDAWDGRTPDEIGRSVVAAAQAIVHEPETAWMYGSEDGDPTDTWTEADLPDLLEIPHRGATGEPEPEQNRVAMARWVLDHLTDDIGVRGLGLERDEESRYLRKARLEPWALAAVIGDALEPDQEFRLTDLSVEDATAFVREHHSHLPTINLRGAMFLLGLKRGGRLVAVAVAGTPTGRWKDQTNVLELTRVASDGTTRNASSKLTARILDMLPRTGRTRFVTYTFPGEEGTSYKALKDKGLRPTGITTDHSEQERRPGGSSRSGTATSGSKLRWEAGPDATPARWDLLETFK